MVSHELLQYIQVQALPHVKHGTLLDALLLRASLNLDVNIEVKVEMARSCLHSPHPPVRIERRATALTLESRSAQLEPDDTPCRSEKVSRDHALDRKPWGIKATGCGPSDLVRIGVVLEVGEFGERKTEPAKELALL
jgi:hypothetical protein